MGNAVINGDFHFFIDQLPTDESHKRNAMQMNRVTEYITVLHTLIERTTPDGKCNLAREELRTLFDYCVGNIPTTPNKFTSLLKHHRIHLAPVWVNNKTVRGTQTKWVDVANFAKYKKDYLS